MRTVSEPRIVDDDRPPAPHDGDRPHPDERPEFGPSGYLPERASKRARKIVLRAPLGLQWVVAAVVAGLVVVAAAWLFLSRSSEPPGPPYERVATVAELPDLLVTVVSGEDVAILTAAGRPRAFAVADGPSGLRYCTEANRLVSDDGSVWLPTGRGLGGVESLDEHPVLAHDGILYVDPTRTVPGPPPSDDPVDPPICD